MGWFLRLSLAAEHREDHLVLWSVLIQSCVHVEVKRRVGCGSRFCAQGSEIQVVTLARAAWRGNQEEEEKGGLVVGGFVI